MAWIGLYEPTEEEFSSVAQEFGLHPLAVEDAVKAHQRPKIEHYDETLFVVLRPARYVDETETVEFGEVTSSLGRTSCSRFATATRPSSGRCANGSRRARPLAAGPETILYAVIDRVVDGYGPVVVGLENDIDEIEDEVFGGSAAVSRRIYELTREVIEFQRATEPLARHPRALTRSRVGREEGQLPARRPGPRHAGRGAGRGISRAAPEHPEREPDARDEGADRGSHQQNEQVKRSRPGPRSCSPRRWSGRSTG